MENSYSSLAVAINNLQDEGFTVDFNLCAAGVENKHIGMTYNATGLKVLRYYRFEGMSNLTTLFCMPLRHLMETGACSLMPYAGNVPKEMINKLRILK